MTREEGFMFSLIQQLGSRSPTIDIVDVGAMWLGEASIPYQALLKTGIARVIGFEPIEKECDKLNAMKWPNHRFLPCFIGDGSKGTFRVCRSPMTSSLLEPNLALLSKFNQLAEITTPVERSECQTRRLDDIPELTNVDLLKIDVQGGELMVLRGAERHLKNAVAVMTEVEFVEMYIGQPLFGDLDAELRRQGFVLHKLGAPEGRAFRPISPNGDPTRMLNQALWADAFYIKDFTRLAELSPTQLLKLAVILHETVFSCDLVGLILQHYDAKTGLDLWTPYMKTLCAGNVPPRPPL
jgi:FkbM family methyltransferase